ncbi:prion-inhibition and propagation domain-containing protein [Trichoderma breve]|uniref:Prion-inhibition and propagation domain-containing protein n=1 Tax=Trichoderma breve TaxID=2034170 RepID=A0A9W9BFQ2_9HYPO|nr:prion-inhibition and propagation domain-containing protein [Trichoderma breve]KAJ4858731.1 prion-inhibition and propagation domain-containing protein [Trichoderma breve]
MAEALGTAIGVIGFVGQLFDGCVKAYGYFTTASNLDSDSQRMMCKVRIEEMRLVVWGREWGVAEGKFDEHLSERNPQLKVLATQILEQLHGTVTDFKKLQDRYGLVDEAATKGGKEADVSPPRKGSKDEGKKTNGFKTSSSTLNLSSERSWRKEIGLRTKWVIGDKDKFSNLLKDLKDFNDGLEALFPPSQVQSFQRAWTHQLLDRAQRDLAELSLLENASSGIYPKLTNSANLKKLRINLDSKPQESFKPTFALKIGRTSLNIQDLESPRRVQAHHVTAGDVLIEWVDYDREEIEERVVHVRRMDDLARMMHSASECHPDLHSIDCLGYTDDAANNRYGLVYKAPASSHSTLKTLISSPDLKTPDLDDRIRLAQTLAVAVWSLHSLDWLHKSICSSNIVFFPSAFSTSGLSPTASAALVPDISLPYLSGFGASRPELDIALSVVPRNPSIEDLHRHPASLRGRPHIKPFDIYSFGLVLLEIGLWKVLQTYYKAHYTAERWRDKVVLAVLVPGLGSKVGKRYREVVEMCLRVDDEMSSSEAGELMEEVVNKLESIRV